MERSWGRWELEDGKSLGEEEGSRRWLLEARWSWPWWGSRLSLDGCKERRAGGNWKMGSPWERQERRQRSGGQFRGSWAVGLG